MRPFKEENKQNGHTDDNSVPAVSLIDFAEELFANVQRKEAAPPKRKKSPIATR
jgi:hypothetical protein